jgi:hypothetical protein
VIVLLLIVSAMQLSPVAMEGYLPRGDLVNFESIVDKSTIIFAMLILYFKGSFESGYIKAFILVQLAVLWLLLVNKIGYIISSNEAGWMAI